MTGAAPSSPGRLHDDATALLQVWRGWDEEQEARRHDYLAFLAEHPDAMWRACVPGHLTASTLVLDAPMRHVLLTLHPKFGLWLQMGGHCEPQDATLRDAALREATEESGIVGLDLSTEPLRLDRHRVGCHGGAWQLSTAPVPFGTPGTCWHLDVQYVAIAPPGAQAVISEESVDLRWWPVDALPDLTDDALRRLVATAVNGA